MGLTCSVGSTYSHDSTNTQNKNGITVKHHENINKTSLKLVMTYTQTGDLGNKKIIVTQTGKDSFSVVNTSDEQQGTDEKTYSKDELLKFLLDHESSEHLIFMTNYLQTHN